MSVQSIGQDTTSSWLSQLLASYSQQSTSTQSSIASLLGIGDSTSTDETSATSSGSSGSSVSSVGSFNDILSALLAGDSSLSYDMETGTLTDLGTSSTTEELPPPPPMEGSDGLTREMTETANEDGSVSRSVTMTDADGNVVGTEETTENTDGSFSSVITMTDANGNTSTRTITGENTEDGGFSVSSTLADADGNVLETGLELTAADGSVTRSLTRTTPEGETVTESESYDADGNLVSTSSSTTTASSSSSSSSSSETASSDSAGSSSGSSDSDETTTTVTTAFTTEGMEQTTTVTDADGNIVSQSVKEMPFSSSAEAESYGNSEASQEGLSSLIGQYASNRYGSSRYAAQYSGLDLIGEESSLSVEA